MDFRTEAASATLDALGDSSSTALASSPESGCVPIPGGARIHKLIALPPFLLSLTGLLGTLTVIALRFTGYLPASRFLLAILPLLALSVMVRSFKSVLLIAYLRSRPDGFPRTFSELPRSTFGLEDGATCQKIKVFIEDSGLCFFDKRRRLVLLEGCEYRYIIRAKDVMRVEPISKRSLSGARVICRVGNRQLDLVLTASGLGPVASLIQAFDPSAAAVDLAKQLNQTFFGSDVSAYSQNALPPLMPRAL
jgi:hypothetical protein